MARRVAISSLNASTIDILNTIRANASYEYQNLVPAVTKATDIPKVGEVLYGYPAMANQFINALVNRIASVRVKSATFNNAYAELKKGYLEFGETVEEVFVNIAKAREFSAEKAESRELKRTLPDVRSAFHTMNWRVQYPVTIQDEDLRMAFLSVDGVTDLIARIVNTVYTAAEYDEYLLFKYLLIKAASHGKMKIVAAGNPAQSNQNTSAVAFRGTSNKLTFMSKNYNEAGVTTATPKADQCIFMSAEFNARFDVNVLASAFNMDKADFMGKLYLIDDFTTFDNERFSAIASESDMIEPVTDEELSTMKNVSAILADKEWFQVYDNNTKFTENYVSSGMYWNYFYNVWKTVSYSPFSNAVVFASVPETHPETIGVEIGSIENTESDIIVTLLVEEPTPDVGTPTDIKFVQTEALTKAGVAVHPYGALIVPAPTTQPLNLELEIRGTKYTGEINLDSGTVGDSLTFTKT